MVQLNGTTDYVELWGYTDGGSINGGPLRATSLTGSLLASGNGLVSGTGATALNGLTDVSLASPATGQVLTYNGTAWVNATPSATTVISGTTSMVSGWPDAIKCSFTVPAHGERIIPLTYAPYVGDGNYYYRAVDGEAPHTNYVGYAFTPAGAYFVAQHYTSAGSQPISSSCDGKSISQLYAEGRAFNFIGNSGAGGSALGDRITSGTLAVSANSSTAIVSLSTNGTTWGYLGSSQSYLGLRGHFYINTR